MSDTPKTEGARFWHRPAGFAVALLILAAVHVGLLFCFEPFSVIFSETPISWLDYDTHIEQTWRVTEALDGWGKAWAYDVQLLAGYPNGTIFDADNKGWELWTYALWKLGLPKGMAFNLFLVLAHLMVPWTVFFASRLFGLSRWTAFGAMAMALLLWYFDGYPRWCWWVGMTEYGFAAYFFLLPFGLFYRYLKTRSPWLLLLLALTMSIAHLIHPYSFVILVLPMLVLYGRDLRRLPLSVHLGVFGMALAVIAANAYWLRAALQFWHYILNSAFYAQSTLSYLLTDYLGLVKEPLVTGVIDNRTGFRFLFLAAAIPGLAGWRRSRDDRFWPFALGLSFLLAVTYLGGYSRVFSQIQPYRHAFPAMYLSVIPAAVFLRELWLSEALRRLPALTFAACGLCLALTGINLTRDMLYFFSKQLPLPRFTAEDELALKQLSPDVANVIGWPMVFRHGPPFTDFTQLSEWLVKNDKQPGRIFVEWWILGEHLAWHSKSEILGGFTERNLGHSAANLKRRFYDRGELPKEEVEQYFRDYAVKWVIISHWNDDMAKYHDLLTPMGYIPPIHRIYQTKITPSYFARGSGRVKASMNRIRVTGTNPREDIVLRYHWLETFVCKEGCRIEKEPLEHDPVGFIRVRAPHPANFTIVNGY